MKSPTHILTTTLVSKTGTTIIVERVGFEHPIADSHSPRLALDQTEKQSRLSAIWNYKIMRVGIFAKILTTLILLATVALCAAALAGCTATRPPEPPSVGNNLGGARALGQFALQNVVTLKTHVDATHEPLRQSTANALTEQDVRLVAAEKASDALSAQLSQTDKDLAATQQALTDERGHWIGYQLRLWGKIIIGVGVAAWVALGAIGTLTPMGGWGSIIMRFLPLANVFTWIRDRFVHPVPTAASPFMSP